MIRVTLVSNAIQLEAARRLRRHALAQRRAAAERGDGRTQSRLEFPPEPRFELLVHEPGRMQLTPEDRRLWPLRGPVSPALMAALAVPALLGLVSELRLSHLCRVGRALRLVARHARRLCLLDDGLDQYRSSPKAVQPEAFPEGTPCWLFSDAPAFRADWCRRFRCHELGPLYGPPAQSPQAGDHRAAISATAAAAAAAMGTLIIDSPGVERLQARAEALPRPWTLVPHPVAAKRSWRLPPQPGDQLLQLPPEQLLSDWNGVVLVGESLMLLAAVRLRPAGSPLLIALPKAVDPNLVRLARSLAAGDPAITLL